MTSGNVEESEVTKAYSWREVWSPTKWGAGDGKFGLTIVILVMLFFFLMVAAFKSSTTYLVFFATDELGMSNSEAAIFSSVVSAAGTMGRAISIGVASCVAIQTQFIVESFGMVFWIYLMAFWGQYDKVPYWICSFFTAFFRDPIWPSVMTWTDKYVVLFAIVVGLSDLASKAADAIFGWVLGYMYTYISVNSIFYVSVLFGSLLCIEHVTMYIVAGKHGERYKNDAIELKAVTMTVQ